MFTQIFRNSEELQPVLPVIPIDVLHAQLILLKGHDGTGMFEAGRLILLVRVLRTKRSQSIKCRDYVDTPGHANQHCKIGNKLGSTGHKLNLAKYKS